jgi:outer membrane lipoprotein SlyB
MKNRFITSIIFTIAFIFSLTGCTYKESTNQSNVGYTSQIAYGTVMQVRDILIDDNGDGQVLGAIAGGIIGSTMGEGNGNALMTGLGAIIGAMSGSSLNQSVGQELTILLDDGMEISTTVRLDKETPQSYRSGDKVRIYYRQGKVFRIEFQNRTKYIAPQTKAKYKKPATEDMIIIDKQTSGLSHDQIQKLKALAQLKKDGILTEEELTREKIRILGKRRY